jgi:hypothetical protein
VLCRSAAKICNQKIFVSTISGVEIEDREKVI